MIKKEMHASVCVYQSQSKTTAPPDKHSLIKRQSRNMQYAYRL